jgi:hypothetical protein
MSPPTGWQLIVSRSVLTMVVRRAQRREWTGLHRNGIHFGAVAADATDGFDVPVFWGADIDADRSGDMTSRSTTVSTMAALTISAIMACPLPCGFARPSNAHGEMTSYTSHVPEEFLMPILDLRRTSPVSAPGATALPGLLALETAPVQVRSRRGGAARAARAASASASILVIENTSSVRQQTDAGQCREAGRVMKPFHLIAVALMILSVSAAAGRQAPAAPPAAPPARTGRRGTGGWRHGRSHLRRIGSLQPVSCGHLRAMVEDADGERRHRSKRASRGRDSRLQQARSGADLQLSDVALVYGTKWKQRYFRKVGDDYFPLGAQWDVSHGQWRPYLVANNTDWWVPHYGPTNAEPPDWSAL